VTRLVVGPFNRVEGDLEVTLETAEGRVRAAYVNSPLYRGFEQILRGKAPLDSLVFAPRICGICSVSQSSAAAAALADAMGLSMPPNGRLSANLIHAAENVADHLTHFYLFFMPDFARPCYAAHAWHDDALRRFQAVRGSAAKDVLPARAGFFSLMGLLAGKWPHTLAIQPGGATRALESAEKIRVITMLREFRRFLETTVFGDALESVASLRSAQSLADWRGRGSRGDFGRFLDIADDIGLETLGWWPARFLCYGAYVEEEAYLFPAGVWDGAVIPLNALHIAEDLSRSLMGGPDHPLHPSEGVTQPLLEKAGGYSWCKAPRLAGQPMETGALARQQVAGHPLVRDLVAASGANVRTRIIARLLEIALIVPRMERWAMQLRPGERYCAQGRLPETGSGVGLVEAARGSLGHWLRIEHGRIRNYQIIAPTTWNFSPRDAAGTPGPLEQALVGTPVTGDEDTPVGVQHVVRSFDPCMVCTVH